jgi:hypothetical protein
MPIRWSVRQVSESLDELEKLLNEAEPSLLKMVDKAQATINLPNVPDYIGQPVGWFKQKTLDYLDGQKGHIKKARGYIPSDALAREQAEFQKLLTFFNGDRDKAEVALNLSVRPKREVPKEQARMGFAYSPTGSSLVTAVSQERGIPENFEKRCNAEEGE